MKQHSSVTYLGSTLSNAMSGESMNFKTLKILAFCVGKKIEPQHCEGFYAMP